MSPREDSPKISDEARGEIIEELEDAVGEEAVEQADLDVERAIEERPIQSGARSPTRGCSSS